MGPLLGEVPVEYFHCESAAGKKKEVKICLLRAREGFHFQ